MRTFLSALIAAAAIAAPTSALAAGKPVPALQVTAVATPSAAATGGCLYSVTGSWDGTRVDAVAFIIFDSTIENQGYVDAGGGYVLPRPARAGSLGWNSTVAADPGLVRITAIFRDHRGVDIGTTNLQTVC